MCIKNGPLQSLLPRLQAVSLNQSEAVDPFEINVSEEDMAQEDVRATPSY